MEDTGAEKIRRMPYVDLMAFIGEINRPPGGKDSVRQLVQNCFINENSKVLDVGCNTGYCSFEVCHLAKCHVMGIDISPEMIHAAKEFKKSDPMGNLVEFEVADGIKIPFTQNSFDVVLSGGSTAFIDNKQAAIKEYKRVLKPWGFLADINFFYARPVPKKVINDLNALMGIKIQKWDENYWLELYETCGLEKYFIYKNVAEAVIDKEIKEYCLKMVESKNLGKDSKKVLFERLLPIMRLFNKNNKYLNYGVFIFRKRPTEDQITLFGA